MNVDITSKLLNGCSPYICTMIYNIASRVLYIECVNNPEEMNPTRRINCPGILKYEEENLDTKFDDEYIDSIIGINWIDNSTLCILTEKKELILNLENEPTAEEIT